MSGVCDAGRLIDRETERKISKMDMTEMPM